MFEFIHGANGQDAPESDVADLEKGHDTVELLVVGDLWRSCFLAVEVSSLNQAETLSPQVGRFL